MSYTVLSLAFLGAQRYELSNHLGNVLVTISDRKLDTVADIYTAQDYYPFGMTMPERSRTHDTAHRYGFQGQEVDGEYFGGGVFFKYRVHDPRIGRFLSIDPLAIEREWLTPYNFVQNNPTFYIDPTGALDTKYKDSEGNILLETDDGSDDEVVVSNEMKADFEYYAESYRNEGNQYFYDSKSWNDNMKAIILGFETTDEMNSLLNGFTTQWARQSAIDFFQNPSFTNAFLMSASESLSQWTDPEKLLMAASIYVAGVRVPIRSTTSAEFNYTYTKSVAKHLNKVVKSGPNKGQLSRPFMRSPMTVEQIMATGKGVPDATAEGALRYVVPGSFRGSNGNWELVINPDKKLIYHFNFVTPKK